MSTRSCSLSKIMFSLVHYTYWLGRTRTGVTFYRRSHLRAFVLASTNIHVGLKRDVEFIGSIIIRSGIFSLRSHFRMDCILWVGNGGLFRYVKTAEAWSWQFLLSTDDIITWHLSGWGGGWGGRGYIFFCVRKHKLDASGNCAVKQQWLS